MQWASLCLALGCAVSASAQHLDLGPYAQRCASAGQALWGVPLCAPVVLVDPASGRFETSRKAPDTPLPALRANTAVKWGGEDWIMVLSPLPQDGYRRAALLFHEGWHAQQEKLGLPANNAVASHLDDPIARYLMRLEWAALEKALTSSGRARRDHIEQALAFRFRRINGAPERMSAERDHMRHEGLAAYTGVALSGAPRQLALEELRSGWRKASLSRSFGYVSGPAWGLLLDDSVPGWREQLKSGADLPDLLAITPASVVRADDYGGTAILAEEWRNGVERAAVLAAALRATAPSRALRLPLASMNMSFDPNSVSAAPDGSPLYRTITLSDRWGEAAVKESVLRITSDYKEAYLPWPLRPSDALKLRPGWRVSEQSGGGAELVFDKAE